MKKKNYVIDRNGRMHLIEITPELTINGKTINDADHAEQELNMLFASRSDITFKSLTHLKVFDCRGLIGFQIVPEYE